MRSPPFAPLFVMLFLIGSALGLGAVGCGEDESCRTHYDCDGDEVCEPDGCRQACDDDGTCPAGQRCVDRQVEPGQVCRQATD